MDETRQHEILQQLNAWTKGNLGENFEIKFTAVSDGSLSATMPVTPKVHQPFGILHGGASVVLAETLGSCLSVINVDLEKVVPVGTNINANHLRAKRSGVVTGTATFIRKGSTLHVSEIRIVDEKGELINHTTMTNAIVPKDKIS